MVQTSKDGTQNYIIGAFINDQAEEMFFGS